MPRKDPSAEPKTSAEPEEREIKFPVEGLDTVRARLIEMEAERLGPPSFEDNWVFDKSGELEAAGCVLRLRTDRYGAHVTFKGPRRFEGLVKVRRETEFTVSEPDAARSLLEALGYSVARRYQKKREEWRLGGVDIALDHTPIGDYVEFEGEKAEVVARRCGFDASKVEMRSYLRLYADHLKTNPAAPPEMVFLEEDGGPAA